MNEANFVKRINWMATGDSFLRELILPMDANRVTTGNLPFSGSTAPTLVTTGVSYAEGEGSRVTFTVPQDYDQDGDRLVLKLHVQPATSASDWGITNARTMHRAGSAVDTTTETARSESSTTAAGSESRNVYLSMSGESNQPGDTIGRLIDVNSSSGEVVLVSMSLIYGSSFAMFKNADRHRDMNVNGNDV